MILSELLQTANVEGRSLPRPHLDSVLPPGWATVAATCVSAWLLDGVVTNQTDFLFEDVKFCLKMFEESSVCGCLSHSKIISNKI